MGKYKFRVRGTKNIYDLELEKLENGDIKSAYCNCKGHAVTKKPCKHIMSLFVMDKDVIEYEEVPIEELMETFSFGKFTETWEIFKNEIKRYDKAQKYIKNESEIEKIKIIEDYTSLKDILESGGFVKESSYKTGKKIEIETFEDSYWNGDGDFIESEIPIKKIVDEKITVFDVYDGEVNYIHSYNKKPYKKFMKTEKELIFHKIYAPHRIDFITCNKELIRSTTDISSKKAIERKRYEFKEIIQNYFDNV